MKIRVNQSIAGMGFSYRPGQEVDHKPDEEAFAFVAAGAAERMADEASPGAAVEQADLVAPVPPGVRRRRRVQPPALN